MDKNQLTEKEIYSNVNKKKYMEGALSGLKQNHLNMMKYVFFHLKYSLCF